MSPVVDDGMADEAGLDLARISVLADQVLTAAALLVELAQGAAPEPGDLRRIAGSAARVVSTASLVYSAATSLADSQLAASAARPDV